MGRIVRWLPVTWAALAALPAAAQDVPSPSVEKPPTLENSVYAGDYLSLGFGVGMSPSYDGSDDYSVLAMPLVQGRVHGIGISPRASGLALDFIPDHGPGPGFILGPSFRVRSNRAVSIKDPVVKSLGKLDYAVEMGATAGFKLPTVFNSYDSLTVNLDARWDIAGAHNGMVYVPSVTYFTPVSRGTAVAVSLNAEYGDDDFTNYYYSITPEGSAASGLPEFIAKHGFTRVGGLVVTGFDLDGDLANGGFSVLAVGGYARMMGDAKDSPITSIRGSPHQWVGGLGLGYTF